MLSVILIVLGVLIDQLTKLIVLSALKGNKPLVIIENLLSFVYVENRGAAFGILQNKKMIFIIFTVISVIILSYLLIFYYGKMSTWLIVALSLIYAGTIGNFLDRMRLGFVVDFISVRIFNRFDFAVFNLADAFIVVGAFMLIIQILFLETKGKHEV